MLDLADFALQEQPENNLMVAISRAWYNGWYTMAAKPTKTLELHYPMITFLISSNIINGQPNINTCITMNVMCHPQGIFFLGLHTAFWKNTLVVTKSCQFSQANKIIKQEYYLWAGWGEGVLTNILRIFMIITVNSDYNEWLYTLGYTTIAFFVDCDTGLCQ